MGREELRGDPAFPYSTNYNYYAGSSHLQQFRYSMPVDYSSWPPPSLDHNPGYSMTAESVNDANSGSGNEDDADCIEVQVSFHGKLFIEP